MNAPLPWSLIQLQRLEGLDSQPEVCKKKLELIIATMSDALYFQILRAAFQAPTHFHGFPAA